MPEPAPKVKKRKRRSKGPGLTIEQYEELKGQGLTDQDINAKFDRGYTWVAMYKDRWKKEGWVQDKKARQQAKEEKKMSGNSEHLSSKVQEVSESFKEKNVSAPEAKEASDTPLSKTLDVLETANANLKIKLDDKSERIQDLEDKNDRLRKENEGQKKRIEDYENEIRKLENRTGNQQAALDKAIKDLKKTQADLVESDTNLEKVRDQNAALKDKFGEKVMECNRLHKQKEQIEDNLQAAEEALVAVEGESQAYTADAALKGHYDELKEKYEKLKTSNAALAEEYRKARQTCSELSDRVLTLNAKVKDYRRILGHELEVSK
ncbi:hypothetical protein [Aureibacillus halotolerans]|uniref:Uncharacterized protein n=1 Tax=Aureibacillus halotolerans TaxID=1508390 RepID=A0A4R6TZ08_9BACI|nr:hypothetical protein [Aureibacillus halotolerans]TDQ39208.1 hypothetical protein EV213_108160 [Aureibacillus halotolerans]